jgi:hypothetical protein
MYFYGQGNILYTFTITKWHPQHYQAQLKQQHPPTQEEVRQLWERFSLRAA